jgi:hypothetical protein
MATFGYQTVGASLSAGANGLLVVYSATAPVTDTVTLINVYLDGLRAGGTISGKARGVVYTDSAGAPGNIVASGSESTITIGQAAGWVALPISASVTAATAYWIGCWFGTGGGGTVCTQYYYDTQTGGQRSATVTYASTGNPTSPFPTPTTANRIGSLYASTPSSDYWGMLLS